LTNYRFAIAKSLRQGSSKLGRNHDLLGNDREGNLLGLIEDQVKENHDDKVNLKRMARSPFDEDIDEKEDSDEDDDVGEDETNVYPSSDTKTVTQTSVTNLKVSTSLPLTSTTAAFTVHPLMTNTTDETTKLPTVGSNSVPKVNTSVSEAPLSTESSSALPAKKGELELPSDYNKLVIPKLKDSNDSILVWVFLNIRSVRDIDESLEVSLFLFKKRNILS